MSTPLSSGNPLYGDFPFFCTAETPLAGLINQVAEEMLIINPDVIRTYQQIILRLELQVLHYQALMKQLARTPEPAEEFGAQPSNPLNEASIGIVNSIVRARIPNESILRAFDDEEG